MSWQEALMGAAGVAFAGTILVVLMVQIASTWRARMAVARESGFRKLADEGAQAQQRTAAQLEQVLAELADIRERTTAMERVLREVNEPWARST